MSVVAKLGSVETNAQPEKRDTSKVHLQFQISSFIFSAEFAFFPFKKFRYVFVAIEQPLVWPCGRACSVQAERTSRNKTEKRYLVLAKSRGYTKQREVAPAAPPEAKLPRK